MTSDYVRIMFVKNIVLVFRKLRILWVKKKNTQICHIIYHIISCHLYHIISHYSCIFLSEKWYNKYISIIVCESLEVFTAHFKLLKYLCLLHTCHDGLESTFKMRTHKQLITELISFSHIHIAYQMLIYQCQPYSNFFLLSTMMLHTRKECAAFD